MNNIYKIIDHFTITYIKYVLIINYKLTDKIRFYLYGFLVSSVKLTTVKNVY